MKKQIQTNNVLSLASDQLEQAIAKGFFRFVHSTSKVYRDYPPTESEILPEKSQRKITLELDENNGNGINIRGGKRSREKRSIKGHVPIRSQTGHDHDRKHHK